MKKYFLKGVDEPLELGDIISFTLEKEINGKKISRDVECTFTEDVIPLLLAEDVIEEKEVEEGIASSVEDTISNYKESEESNEETDKDDVTIGDVIDAILEAQKETESTIEVLADEVKKLKKKVTVLEKKSISDTGGEYVNLKDYIKRNKDIYKPLHNFRYTEEPTFQILYGIHGF